MAIGKRIGYWVQGDYYNLGDVCSECDYDSCECNCYIPVCPNCGAEMYLGEDYDEKAAD